ncbi:MAG: hypothetical protein ABW167_13275 [Baekduia sp.]
MKAKIHVQTAVIAVSISALMSAGGAVAATSLITGKQIKNGSVTRADLAVSARPATSAQLRSAVVETVNDPTLGLNITIHGEKGDKGDGGTVGATGANGAQGAQGTQGAQGAVGAEGKDGANGSDGANGANGANGTDGLDGANAATQVLTAGEHGWTLPGSPAATIERGELRLGGGNDLSTPAEGGIGAVLTLPTFPALSTLNALSFSFHVDDRPNASTAVPVIHLSLSDVNRTDVSNVRSTVLALVGRPADVGAAITLDSLEGDWKSLRPIAGDSDLTPQSLADIVAANPEAKISRISVDNGGPSGGPDAFAAGVDNVVVGFGDSFERYDFGG